MTPSPSPLPPAEQPHKLVLEGRSKLSLTGVTQVESFDDNTVTLVTSKGILTVQGRDLHLQSLSLDGGQAAVDGQIDSLYYEEPAAQAGRFFARLLGRL